MESGWWNVMVIVMILLAVMLGKQAQATKHTVGGSQGWDASTDFNSWASTQIFKVGDQLVFKYTPGMHSVVELSGKPAYEKCDISSTALDTKSSGGNGEDVIKLTKTGIRYFACGTLGHCSGGMKLKINVVNSTSSSTTPESSDESPSSTSTDDASSNTTTTSSTSDGSSKLKDCSVLVMLVLALVNICLMDA